MGKKDSSTYEVVVGNIGRVFLEVGMKEQALATYNGYVALSRQGYGRAADEGVTLFVDGEPEKEHLPGSVPASVEEIAQLARDSLIPAYTRWDNRDEGGEDDLHYAFRLLKDLVPVTETDKEEESSS